MSRRRPRRAARPAGTPSTIERRRPLGEDDVLEQVRAEQRRRRERVERRGGGGEHEQQAAAEARESPARDALSAHADRVRAREPAEDEQLVREVPPDRVHAGYRGSERTRAWLKSVELRDFQSLVTGSTPVARLSSGALANLFSEMKTRERDEARRLRAEGRSMREITKLLAVSKSSVSLWVRDIELSPAQREALRQKNAIYDAQRKGNQVWSARRRAERARSQEEGRLQSRQRDAFHAAGCMLYWAEGSKERNTLGLIQLGSGGLALLPFLPQGVFRSSRREGTSPVQPFRRPPRATGGDRAVLARTARSPPQPA